MISVFRSASLVSKVTMVTSLVLIAVISFMTWWEIRIREASIKSLTEEKTRIISEFIEKNTIRAMERGRHFDIHQILKNFTYRGIQKINLFRPDGIIRASTLEEERNKKVPDVDVYLKNPYFIREERVKTEGVGRGRERIYYFNTSILNKPECFIVILRKNR